MNFTLTRLHYLKDGIFSKLVSEDQSLTFYTVEHAYETPEATWRPKIPPGQFRCVRGLHRLEGMTQDFQTFEITGVEGHVNLLFHVGNTNSDSSGCVCVGKDLRLLAPPPMVTQSKESFARFMSTQDEVDEFILTVA